MVKIYKINNEVVQPRKRIALSTDSKQTVNLQSNHIHEGLN